MTYHIPICPVCRENEVGAYCGSDTYCSWKCEDIANGEGEDREQYNNWAHEAYQSMYDDDPSPYDGTYSEE